MHHIKMLKETIMNAIICTDIDPTLPDAYEQVDQALKDNGITSGTTSGWKAIRPNDQMAYQRPSKCEDKEGFWHYVVWC